MEDRLTADKVYGFSQLFLHSRFDLPQRTPECHLDWWELACDRHPWVAIAAPRGHAKSTSITHSYTIANLVFRYRSFALIVSDTEGQAVQFLADIKREFTENEDLISVFKIKRLIKDTDTIVIVEMEDGHQFCLMAKGSNQKIRGLKWRNRRPDLIIGDDLENDEIVMNEERRTKFRQWFFNALIPAGSDNCNVRIVGTILHMDSLLERLMPPWGSPDTIVDGLRQISADEDKVWKSVRYEAHNDDFSLILWPEKFNEKRLRAIRQTFIDQGFPEGYNQEYRNYPIDDSTAYFRKDDFFDLDDREEYLEFYVGGDLAISEKDGRAYTAFVVAGLNAQGILKVVDVRRFRGDSLEIVGEIFSLQMRYNPQLFFLETENIAKSIGPFLYERMGKNGMPIVNIEKIPPTQDKVKRARSIQARMRAGMVQFDTEASWFNDFYTELTQFPRGVYKDQVDAFAMIGLGLANMADVPTQAELEDEEAEDEYWDSLFDFSGADEITGY